MWNVGLPEPKFVRPLTHNEDEIDVICHILQICPKSRHFPYSLSGAKKEQNRIANLSSETLSIKYDPKDTMNINGR